MNNSKLIYWFEEVGKEHNDRVGKKCANLGEMTRMGLLVPPGFAISIDMYRKFVQDTGVNEEISRYVSSFGELKGRGITIFEEMSQTIRSVIEGRKMLAEIEKEIISYYEELCRRVKISDVSVSVRSAGTQSRPGMFETYLNVKGKEDLLDKVKKVWASAYTTRAIAFRINKNLPLIGDELGVAVPKMVNARAAGIGFTVDPTTGDASKIVIEANWGLGEGVVSGAGSVDRFVVDKQSLELIESAVGQKLRHVVSKEKGAEWEEIPPERQSIPCLSNEEVKEVAKLAKSLDERLGCPQDMEWAIDLDFPFPQNIFLLQTRPAKVAVKKPESVTDRMIDLMAKRFRI
jgi:pyruvate,water dikinase